jgi:hypothetical protein
MNHGLDYNKYSVDVPIPKLSLRQFDRILIKRILLKSIPCFVLIDAPEMIIQKYENETLVFSGIFYSLL